ncbi:MAG: hypothetical protein H6718_21635 [Polyangiaceae bacterium]|nr:hypothetical protein [Polyangiaceae bacterium]
MRDGVLGQLPRGIKGRLGWGAGIALAVLAGCSAEETDRAGGPADAGADGDATNVDGAVDAGLKSQRPPPDWASADFIDVHTHCELMSDCAGARCCDTSGLASLEGLYSARAVLLSNEYWLINEDIYPAEAVNYFTGLNETARDTAAKEPEAVGFFAGLRCLYQRKVDESWAEACKAEARDWARQGAIGFKDHIGKQYETGEAEGGMFIGGWNRFNGFCVVPQGSLTPNSSCMQQSTVHYLALEPAWREVVRYIVAELRLPIVSHAASYQGATTTCYDPELGAIDNCALVTRRHQQSLATWLSNEVDSAARRRFIVAHMGFLTGEPAGLVALLDTGVSVDTSRLDAFAAAGCQARSLFAAYPQQILFGTDRRVSQTCLPASYSAWMHILRGPADQAQSFDTCQGTIDARGLELGTPQVAGCPDVPSDALTRVLKQNFLELYE